MGTTASSDGQFFTSARQGEPMNMVNAKHGNKPGLKAYTHVNDHFAPFASQTIPATVSEAPYILHGLLMNEAGRQVGEQYGDTTGFTDHLFGTSSMLGYRLVPRIRDLPSKRLYVFNPAGTSKDLRKLVGGEIREELIIANWPDLFRCAATMVAGKFRPSQLLHKLASYPRQNDLAVALREVGRVERTIFIIDPRHRHAAAYPKSASTKARLTMLSRMRCVSAARVKSETEPPRAKITASPG